MNVRSNQSCCLVTFRNTGCVRESADVTAVFPQNAEVHDDLDSGGFGTRGGFAVDDRFLQPEVGDAAANHFVHDLGDRFWTAKDVYDINRVGHIREGGVGGFAEGAGG